MHMQAISDLELDSFREAIEGLNKEELKALKTDLNNKKEDIELQFHVRGQSADEADSDYKIWKIRAQYARAFTVRKMTLVNAALAKAQKIGGYLIKLNRRSSLGFASSVWLATERHPAEVLVDELSHCSVPAEAPDVQFFLSLTADQFERLPAWTLQQPCDRK